MLRTMFRAGGNPVALLLGLGVLVASGYGLSQWYANLTVPADSEESQSRPDDIASAPLDSMVLEFSKEKQIRAGLNTAVLEELPFQPLVTSLGRARFIPELMLDVRAPVDLRIVAVHTSTGQRIEAGQPLFDAESAAIGELRTKIAAARMNVAIAQRERERAQAIYKGVLRVEALMAQSPEPERLAHQLEGVVLGKYRGDLVSAYAQFYAAREMYAPLSDQLAGGAIPGKTVSERRQRYVEASALLQSSLERATFESRQHQDSAEVQYQELQRRLNVLVHELESYIGRPDRSSESDDPNRWTATSPMAGIVVDLPLAVGSRMEPGELLGTVADASRIWIECAVRRDVMVQLGRIAESGTVCRVLLPDGNHVEAFVRFIGQARDEAPGVIPVVVECRNPDLKIRKGQLLSVDLPLEKPVLSRVVPVSAVVEVNGQASVFVRRSPDLFEAVAVETGMSSNGVVQILSGPAIGAEIVTDGAFQLASELMLEPEE